MLQRIRWGQLSYAPLRYKNSPGDRLDWDCGTRTQHDFWKQFNCDWEGNAVRPGNVTLRSEKEVTVDSKDLIVDSIEMQLVRYSC